MPRLLRLQRAVARRLTAFLGGLLAPGDGIAPRGAGMRRTAQDRLPETGALGGDGSGAASC